MRLHPVTAVFIALTTASPKFKLFGKIDTPNNLTQTRIQAHTEKQVTVDEISQALYPNSR